ncbi:MAG: glutamate 5-kinase [Betaproteobacteria bacterium AqS2]|uniref:Glutamate 5-kinase n=1 Tax=Candidatus Amphirhobacter heronislandensis TaxID=1732024 RepID=A0A930XXK1_9GAMM|nr:glutamate 5-kinase [Betaproteobacteria bacterium AqS2]
MEDAGALLGKARRIVVKVGSSLLTAADGTLKRDFIAGFGRELAKWRGEKRDFAIVTSGAVAAGMSVLGRQSKPQTITDMHVMAAVGQISLFRAYDEILSPLGFMPAQVLLTAEELAHRTTYINARSTLRRLFELGVVPIVNENDAIAITDRRFGDNDRLAAEIANLIEAELLVILTDVPGVYRDLEAKELLAHAVAADELLDRCVDDSRPTRHGSGGMGSKIEAARRAANSGAATVIAAGADFGRLVAGEGAGTLITDGAGPVRSRMRAKERWLATCAKANGSVYIDEGAVAALLERGRSLLPAGVTRVEGSFQRGDVVSCLDGGGTPVAQGMINYASHEVAALARRQSSEIEKVLGYVIAEEIIHRDNMVRL